MRLFIAIHYLEIGGVETSLINLLLALDPQRVEVDLLVYDPRGEMMEFIPGWVKQIEAPKAYRYIERPPKGDTSGRRMEDGVGKTAREMGNATIQQTASSQRWWCNFWLHRSVYHSHFTFAGESWSL